MPWYLCYSNSSALKFQTGFGSSSSLPSVVWCFSIGLMSLLDRLSCPSSFSCCLQVLGIHVVHLLDMKLSPLLTLRLYLFCLKCIISTEVCSRSGAYNDQFTVQELHITIRCLASRIGALFPNCSGSLGPRYSTSNYPHLPRSPCYGDNSRPFNAKEGSRMCLLASELIL